MRIRLLNYEAAYATLRSYERIVRIMAHRLAEKVTLGRKLLLATAAVAIIGGLLGFDIINAPPLHAQSSTSDWENAAGGKMSFEVASVKRNKSGQVFPVPYALDDTDAYRPTGGLFSRRSTPLLSYIGFAYKLSLYQENVLVSEAPEWVVSENFDIEARAAGTNPTKDQMRVMMQSLLADRFKLAVHVETRQAPVFALVLVKPGKTGPQLRPYSGDPPCGDIEALRFSAEGFPNMCGFPRIRRSGAGVRVGSSNVTLEYFADSLYVLARLDRPVLDRTGLSGKFNVALSWTQGPLPDAQLPSSADAQPETSGPTLQRALEEQLGMKLDSTKGPVQTLVIDHVEEPSPN
jgi:uncharacterized protein (TIGR03435 family)